MTIIEAVYGLGIVLIAAAFFCTLDLIEKRKEKK